MQKTLLSIGILGVGVLGLGLAAHAKPGVANPNPCLNVNTKMLCPFPPNSGASAQQKPVNRPVPAGTPCGSTVLNGQVIFVNPQTIPGSYCDRDGTLQYR